VANAEDIDTVFMVGKDYGQLGGRMEVYEQMVGQVIEKFGLPR